MMEYKPEDLKRVHDIEIEILLEIIRVCEENDISYFAYGGTLLGTIRHDGFIPWDDDIDIGMMRDDYVKFLRIAPTALKKGFTLQHYSVEPGTPTYHAKVRKDGTVFVEEYAKDLKMHHGIFVDIMPHDYIPEDEAERANYRKKANLYKQLFIAKTVTETSLVRDPKKKKWQSRQRKLLHVALIPVPKKYLFNKYDAWLSQFNEKKSRYVCTRGMKNNENLYTSLFPLKKHRFEDIEIAVPADPDTILRNCYGDYMKLPAPEKRVSHSPYILKFDTGDVK